MLTVLVAPDGERYKVVPTRNGDRLFVAYLEVSETSKGPRPTKFRIVRDDDQELREPSEFVDLCRMADEVVVPRSSSDDDKREVEEMLSAYQIEAVEREVCRLCLVNDRYTSLSDRNAVKHHDERICQDCAKEELGREISYKGDLSSKVRDRLENLLVRVGDVQKLVGLLNASLDPELTKFDEISRNEEEHEEIELDDLPIDPEFRDLLPFETLLPVQALSVRSGLFEGEDQAVVSATATGKTLVGELAGIQNVLDGKGKTLFLVPLVALANQKYSRFDDSYSGIVDVTQRVGSNRIYDTEESFDPSADVVVGTYEGVDHALRTGRDLGEIGTVVIDEVHNLQDDERGHRLDGTLTRLRNYAERGSSGSDVQWIYLSATVGDPEELAAKLDASLVEYEERPVPIERHLTFADATEKPDVVEKLVKREYNTKSSKGYRGQTIVFTNSRRRCHELAGRIEVSASPYHAGLSYNERKRTERRFEEGDVAAVVTTAALGAGVDFPASQVVFERLAMGIEWLTVQEFEQMLGRAGRPDYHDRGVVYLLAEPDASYHSSMERTEDEVALDLLEGEMSSRVVKYDEDAAAEETLANIVVAGDDYRRLNEGLLGDFNTERALEQLRELGLVRGEEVTRLGQIAAEQFLSPDEAEVMVRGIEDDEPLHSVLAELDSIDDG